MYNNEEVTLEEKNTVFHYFRHIPNEKKQIKSVWTILHNG